MSGKRSFKMLRRPGVVSLSSQVPMRLEIQIDTGVRSEPPVAHRNQPHPYREVLSTISRELHPSFQRRCVP
jgi:hypothetical protein